MPPYPPAPPPFGPLLARLRRARGWSQSRLAAELCAAAGVPTLSRHEISRWERQRRRPGRFWRAWLTEVLDPAREQHGDDAPVRGWWVSVSRPDLLASGRDPRCSRLPRRPRQPPPTGRQGAVRLPRRPPGLDGRRR
ncbi:helix-turn-helix domain-containing protein [Micromonospora sp. CA-263727]|uniref:helix-turn-helix domain-containing protein n=1 Tax=Micromonospora sp. CA-263727 TaxID=3239967 RepID=UPI003D8FDD81